VPPSYVVGTEATISELADFICAAQIAKAEDAFFAEDEVVLCICPTCICGS
jgi:hypothetical protein